jgi:hypothetical protein
LLQVIYWHGHQQYGFYLRTAAASFYVTMVEATPYKLFLKVPWVNKQLASSDFTFMRRQKADGVKYAKNGAERTSLRLFPQPVIEKRSGNGFLGAGLGKKQVLFIGPLSPKTTINLCQGLMKVSCSNGFAPGDIVRRRRPCLVGD